ncbi:MAG: hypothetical protein OEZ43_11145 [Gammaproteobacteria bacterium]|nr:hypothetical protein [Gammaproteobacteria bacterium]
MKMIKGLFGVVLLTSVFSSVADAGPSADIFSQITQQAEQPEAAQWLSQESKSALELLNHRNTKILLLPVQVQKHAIDRPGRLAMAQLLAEHLRRHHGQAIIDPALVEQALGRGLRRHSGKHVYQLANLLKAEKIVWVFVGHELDLKLDITAIVQTRNTQGGFDNKDNFAQREWTDLSFSDESLPLDVFQKHLPELSLWIDANTVEPKTVKQLAAAEKLFAISDILENHHVDDYQQAINLQIMGALLPLQHTRHRDAFFVRSLAVLERIKTKDMRYQVIKARALAHLYRRPAALALLEKNGDQTALALRFYLDGDYAGLKAAAGKIDNPYMRLLSQIELYDLHWKYEKSVNIKDELAQIAKTYGEWEPLVLRRLSYGYVWFYQSNLEIKTLLDSKLPLSGASAKDMFASQMVFGGTGQVLESELSPYTHISDYRNKFASHLCCDQDIGVVSKLDFLNYLEDLSIIFNLRAIEIQLINKGKPREAKSLIDQYRVTYAGLPSLMWLEAKALDKLAQESSGTIKDNFEKRGFSLAYSVYYWEQGQTANAISSVNHLMTRRQVLPFFNTDFPRRSYWTTNTTITDRDLGEERSEAFLSNALLALKYAISDFSTFKDVVDALNEQERVADIEALIAREKHRFHGALVRENYFASRAIRTSSFEQAKEIFSGLMKSDPRVWDGYFGLGQLLIDEGKFSEAENVFWQYPVFSDYEGENKVAVSNEAGNGGMLLASFGAYEQARPLLELSKKLHTFSAISLMSEWMLAMYEDDLVTAAKLSGYIGKRYNAHEMYAAYLNLLYAFGHNEIASALFNSLLSKDPGSPVWAAAAVNSRIQNMQPGEVEKWLKDYSGDKNQSVCRNRFVFKYFVEDKEKPVSVSHLLRQYDDEKVFSVKPDGQVYVRERKSHLNTKIGPDVVANKDSDLKQGELDINEHQLFLDAYVALLNDELETAVAAFAKRSRYISHDLAFGAYGLPYYVRAYLRQDKTEYVEKYLSELTSQSAYYYLAQALLAGKRGDHQRAVAQIERAIVRKKQQEGDLIDIWYTFNQVFLWLYEDTQQIVYAELAKKWARHERLFNPTAAWAYMVEARFTDNREERLSLLAHGLYLDPQSASKKYFRRSELEKAKKMSSKVLKFTLRRPDPRDIRI